MSSKNAADKVAGKPKRGSAGIRRLSVFPTDVAKLPAAGLARLELKPDRIAAEVLQALKKHGTDAGGSRDKVLGQMRAKFPKASDATIRTQVYRGIAYLRGTAGGR